jgi:hypothetical protein
MSGAPDHAASETRVLTLRTAFLCVYRESAAGFGSHRHTSKASVAT